MPKFQPKNQFWKARATHGRDMIFSSPDLMWEAAKEYFQWCDENPFKMGEWKTEDKTLVKKNLKTARPYTLTGLLIFWDVNTKYLAQFKADKDKCTADFTNVIDTIENILFTQKFTGATIGIYNANIISRDLGLADKKELKHGFNLNDLDVEFE